MDFSDLGKRERSIRAAGETMPIYEYECKSCGHSFERIMKVGEEAPACPACGAGPATEADRALPDERLVHLPRRDGKAGQPAEIQVAGRLFPPPRERRRGGSRNEKGTAIEKIHGNLTGLAPAEIKRIGQLYRRRVPPERIVTHDLARQITELSREINRQIGILITRKGEVAYVIVGPTITSSSPLSTVSAPPPAASRDSA